MKKSWGLAMKPLYCGNIEYEARQTDIERLFGRYGRVDRVDMKSGNKQHQVHINTQFLSIHFSYIYNSILPQQMFVSFFS